MEIKGKVVEIGLTVQVSETFKKRDLIVEYAENPSYPEFIKFDVLQDKVALLDGLKVGDTVEVGFNLRGKPYTDKAGKKGYFNSLNIWRVNVLAAGGSPEPQYVPPVNAPAIDLDEMPF